MLNEINQHVYVSLSIFIFSFQLEMYRFNDLNIYREANIRVQILMFCTAKYIFIDI